MWFVPNMHYLLCYFLTCHYSVFKFAKGQDLEVTFSLFSVYFGVGAITLWRSFSYLIKEESDLPHHCVWNGKFHLFQLPRSEHLYYGSSLGIFLYSGLMKILHHVLQQLVVTSSLITQKCVIFEEWKAPVIVREIWNHP